MGGYLPCSAKVKKGWSEPEGIGLRSAACVTPGDFLKEVLIPVFTGGFGGFVGSEVSLCERLGSGIS